MRAPLISTPAPAECEHATRRTEQWKGIGGRRGLAGEEEGAEGKELHHER
jgi:hypothetical protein